MRPATSSIIWSIVNFDSSDIRLTVHPRARRMRLRIDPRSGALHLTIPRRASREKALAWARGQQEWVARTRAAMAPAVPIVPGMIVPLEGAAHRLDWAAGANRRVFVEDGAIRIGGPAETLAPRLLRFLKARALATLTAETQRMAEAHRLSVTRIAVGDPVSRWGSCASSGAIRYNWRLILAPVRVRRATVAHEVAHLAHMNHGPDFHALAARILGEDPAPARRWLKRHGAALHRFGRS